jgi:hypothetical protein
MSSFMELLDKCRDQQFRYGNVPSANFYHLFGRKLPSSVLNQACFCGMYLRSHLAKGHGNKAAVRTVEVGPLVRATCLASLSAFQFP